MSTGPVKVGIVGCGNISGIYLQNAPRFEALQVVACADLVQERAEAQAAKYKVPKACTLEALLADPEVELVINLTIPRAHAAVALAALAAGKHVYNEKPLGITRAEGKTMLAAAAERKLRIGGAPDTFMGAGLQTARRVLDEGRVGAPVAATAFMVCHGHEGWHPDPAFYYEPGGGPLLDMGPYYLTALVSLLGPVQRVASSARITFPTRTITSQPKRGQTIKVQTPTHITGALEFASGAVATLIMSFDVWSHNLPLLELHGAEGSLSLPDPNFFGGPLRVRQPGQREWTEIPLAFDYHSNDRILGVADMAQAIRSGRPHRANGELTFHVLDVMQALLESSEQGQHITIGSTCERPAPLVQGLPTGRLDP